MIEKYYSNFGHILSKYSHPGISVSSFRGGTVSNVLAYFLAACRCACRASISFLVLGMRHLNIQHKVITEEDKDRQWWLHLIKTCYTFQHLIHVQLLLNNILVDTYIYSIIKQLYGLCQDMWSYCRCTSIDNVLRQKQTQAGWWGSG